MDEPLDIHALRQTLLQFLQKRLPSPEEAEDILQDVLLKLHTTAHPPADGKLRSWLGTVMRNAVTDFYRKKREHASDQMDLVADQVFPSPGSEAHLEQTAGRCAQDWLGGFVEKLPAKYAEVLEAVELQGQSQVAFALQNQIPVSTVKTRVQRGREKLRGLIAECCRITPGSGNLELESRKGDCC